MVSVTAAESRMKAVLQYRASSGFRERLRARAPEWLHIVVVDEDDASAIRRELENAEVLLHVLTPVTAAMLDAAPKLKLVQKIGVGVNTIAVDAAKSRGIAVANMPGANSQAVAEHTLTLMLAALRRVAYLDIACRRGSGWNLPPDTFDAVGELSGRTVGFVGYGAIPRRLTAALVALGAQVVYYARNPAPDPAARQLASLQALLAQADIVSLHIPLTSDTRGLLDADALRTMRLGAVLINTARGELIDERALFEALQSGKVAAAGLDVFAAEPADADNPLLSLPNVVATPHIAWLTPQTLERSICVIVENCQRLRDGEPLLNQV
jgi:phosphoglycerate dehydrogenase-like enzyme